MDQPDYSKYSESELRQICKHIDAVRYPERVVEIQARLAALAAAPREISAAEEGPALPATVAGVWCRIGAFLIDSLILALIGVIVGACLRDQLMALGPWGRVVGFVIATFYFGVPQSRIGRGQSLGMTILGLRVIRPDGSALGLGSALLRAAIFCMAYFLSNLPAAFTSLNEWVASGLSMLLFGVTFCVFYLLLFNRRTRQSLHDLAVGAFVIRATRGPLALPTARAWRGHAAIVAASLMGFGVAGVWMARPGASDNAFGGMLRVRHVVMEIPGVTGATVMVSANLGDGGGFNLLNINAIVDTSTPDREALARHIAKLALENYANAKQMKAVTVTLTSGFDIGIAQFWQSQNYTHTPQEWRVALLP